MLETERLLLRPLTAKDVNAVYALRSSAEVMRYIRAPQKDREQSAGWIKLVSSRWQTEKIGFCAVIEKQSREFVGWCGLWRLQETGETEIGYALAVRFQGKGYATEAARRCLLYGFETLNLEKIVAVARPENTASRRVMQRLGMRYDGIGVFYGADLARYSITNEEFKQNERDF